MRWFPVAFLIEGTTIHDSFLSKSEVNHLDLSVRLFCYKDLYEIYMLASTSDCSKFS